MNEAEQELVRLANQAEAAGYDAPELVCQRLAESIREKQRYLAVRKAERRVTHYDGRVTEEIQVIALAIRLLKQIQSTSVRTLVYEDIYLRQVERGRQGQMSEEALRLLLFVDWLNVRREVALPDHPLDLVQAFLDLPRVADPGEETEE